jgi:hypothetical protein
VSLGALQFEGEEVQYSRVQQPKEVIRRWKWQSKLVGKPVNGIGDSFCSSASAIHAVATEVFKSWTKIPPGHGMNIPGATYQWFLVDKNFETRWGEWCLVKVKSSMDLHLGRVARLESGDEKEN